LPPRPLFTLMYALSIIGIEYNKKSNNSIKGVEIVGK
jgi:hypothetical protein